MPDDVVIPPTRLLENFKLPVRTTPTYLVVINNCKPKELDSFFIAVKRDDALSNCAKFVGFFCDKTKEAIQIQYDQIIKETDIQNFIEIEFPWYKICSIQSLIYRHKQTK